MMAKLEAQSIWPKRADLDWGPQRREGKLRALKLISIPRHPIIHCCILCRGRRVDKASGPFEAARENLSASLGRQASSPVEIYGIGLTMKHGAGERRCSSIKNLL